MTSPQYRKGRRAEHAIVNKARNEGKIALRSAGSKSPIDVVTVDCLRREIELIQSKVGADAALIKRIEEKNKNLNGVYTVRFKCL